MFRNWLFFIAGFACLIVVFFKNAWISEDAYIIFRSIEQLFAGNGPIWNPHERVQVFTSPLWYWVLASIRFVSKDLYLNTIFVSFVLWVFTIIVVSKIWRNAYVFLIGALLLCSSTAFFDYTSSGLENILAYFFIALHLKCYFDIFDDVDEETPPVRRIVSVFILFGLLICVRHDLSLLVFPATAYVMVRHFRRLTISAWAGLIVLSLLPFIVWTCFSLLYYGFPFPNTAYAKLNTGISQYLILGQGLKYLLQSLGYDFMTMAVIACAIIWPWIQRERPYLYWVAIGLLLNLIYVVYVGGDFMQGRFLSYAYLVSTVMLLYLLSREKFHKAKNLLLPFFLLYALFYFHTPFNSPITHHDSMVRMGVADERGFYFKYVSLYNYLNTGNKESNPFPNAPESLDGVQFRNSATEIISTMPRLACLDIRLELRR